MKKLPMELKPSLKANNAQVLEFDKQDPVTDLKATFVV